MPAEDVEYTALDGLFVHAVHCPPPVAPFRPKHAAEPFRYVPTTQPLSTAVGHATHAYVVVLRRYVPARQAHLPISALPEGDQGSARGHGTGGSKAVGQ